MSLTNINTASDVDANVDCTITSDLGNLRGAIVVVEVEGTAATTCTCNGVAYTTLVITARSNNGTGSIYTHIFWFADAALPATGGVYTFATNASGSVSISVYTADGFDQSGASDSGKIEANGTGAEQTITLSSAGTGALLVGGLCSNTITPTLTPGTNQTTILAETSIGSSKHISSYNSDDNTHSYTNSTTNAQAIVAASFELSGPSVTAINSGAAVTDGQQDVSVTYDNFGGAITTATLKATDGATLNYSKTLSFTTGGAGEILVDFPDVSAITSTTAGIPFTSATFSLTLELTDGTDTASGSLTLNPKSGYAKTDVASAVTTFGSFFYGFTGTPADNDEVNYPTASTTSIAATGIVTSDLADGSTLSGQVFDQSDGNWKYHSILFNLDPAAVAGGGLAITLAIGIGI